MLNKLIGSKSQSLTTITFTSNDTWVAPAGVTNVVSIEGKGSNGVSDSLGNVANFDYHADKNQGSPPFANSPYASYTNLYNYANTTLSTLNAGGSGTRYITTNFIYEVYCAVVSDNTWVGYFTYSGNPLAGVAITGTCSISSLNGGPTSGNVVWSSMNNYSGSTISVSGYIAGHAGSNATALGQTFAGGTYTGTYPNATGNAASASTYYNISVTPGNSYSIVVPSGGYVTLNYYS